MRYSKVWRSRRNPGSKLFGNCDDACDPELCRLLSPYMRNPCHYHSSKPARSKKRARNLPKRRSALGDCSKACDPELCRLLKPYMR